MEAVIESQDAIGVPALPEGNLSAVRSFPKVPEKGTLFQMAASAALQGDAAGPVNQLNLSFIAFMPTINRDVWKTASGPRPTAIHRRWHLRITDIQPNLDSGSPLRCPE